MKINKFIGPIGAFLMVIAAPMAHADLKLTYTIDALPTVDCGTAANPDPTVDCANVPLSGVNAANPINIITLSATSTSPGDPSGAEEDSAAVRLFNPGSVAHTIVINVASNGFTAPTIPPAPAITFFSNIGGSVAIGSPANSLSFQSCGDLTNSLNGCPGTNQTAPVTPDVKLATSNYSAGDSGVITTAFSGPYAVDELIVITLGAGASLNFSASTVLTVAPEPMSVALLGGVLMLTAGVMRRKRKQMSKV